MPALTPDTFVMIRRNHRSMLGGNVAFQDLRDLHWRPMGPPSRRMLCARVWCNLLRTGMLELYCDDGPHDLQVCIVKADNPELFELLAALAK